VGPDVLEKHAAFIFVYTLKMVAVRFFEILIGPATYQTTGWHYSEDNSRDPYRHDSLISYGLIPLGSVAGSCEYSNKLSAAIISEMFLCHIDEIFVGWVIGGSHSGGYEEFYLLGNNFV
jgi:hypothetical protein